jgi:hypothetical protein
VGNRKSPENFQIAFRISKPNGYKMNSDEKGRRFMKSLAYAAVYQLLLVAACALSFTGVAGAQTEAWEREAGRLEGSWTVKVTQVSCQTRDAMGDPFFSLLTFSQGGTLLESTANPMFFPAVRGDGHGVWSVTARQTYRAVSTAFITLNGELSKTQTITQKIVMGTDPNTFETPSASVVFVPANGGPTITGCATATGSRIQ